MRNEKGSVLVFITLMIVVLLAMVGFGLDTGELTTTRSQGQAAVDAAALSAVSGLPVSAAEVTGRAGAFNTVNDYVGTANSSNRITGSNVTYVNYDEGTGLISPLSSIAGANGVRVALEETNPYTSVAANTAIGTPAFLTPILKLMGLSATPSHNINVSAVAVLVAVPSIPIAIYQNVCNGSTPVPNVQLLTSPSTTDNSCWTTYWTPPVDNPDVQALFTASKTCTGLSKGGTGSGPINLGNGVTNPVYGAANALFSADWTQCWIVPVVPTGSSCNRTDNIVDWAKICPTKVISPPTTDVCPIGGNGAKCIIGTVTCGQSRFRTTDNLCFSERLVREPKSASCTNCFM